MEIHSVAVSVRLFLPLRLIMMKFCRYNRHFLCIYKMCAVSGALGVYGKLNLLKFL